MSLTTTHALIAIGSNLGDRSANIERSLAALDALPEVRLAAVSTVIETEPVGPAGQGPYLNAAAELATTVGSPRALLDCLLGVEHWLGRDRSREERWGPRVIDLDLLAFGDAVTDEPGLVVPHPRLHERDFVLIPLAEIAPDFLLPRLDATPATLLERLRAGQRPAHTP